MKIISYEKHTLSKLLLGTVQFGLDYGIANSSGQPKQKDVNSIIDYVYSEGIHCFDTAQAYGTSEVVLGTATEKLTQKKIISKLKSDTFRKNAEQSVYDSLNNLKIKTLFALLLHDSQLLYDWKNEDSAVVDSLIDSGTIEYFGVSIYTSEDFELAINNNKISFIQIPFNLFDQRAYREKWFEQAKEHNKLIFIRSVYLQGLLLMDMDSVPTKLESAKKYIELVEQYASHLKISKNELALSYVDSIAENALILFGCDDLDQAKENIQNYKNLKQLSPSQIVELSNLLANVEEEVYNPTRW